MKVDLITETDSDLTVVNAARCSFDKESTWAGDTKEIRLRVLKDGDIKLINYLAAHQHWTPFGHPQECFMLGINEQELVYFLINANLSGFEWVKDSGPFLIRGSLYAWLTNMQYIPPCVRNTIYEHIQARYPISLQAFLKGIKMLGGGYACEHVAEPKEDELCCYTLRIHAPIFVKRQLETHRRNFVMTDIEDFAQNEVSRRYVDSEPEFYTPKEWRIQAKDKKQGSSDEKMEKLNKSLIEHHYDNHLHHAKAYYNIFNGYGTAHEQSRMVLPLSTYTTWWWTGSVKSWKRMAALRLEEHTQSETRELAGMICDALPTSF